MKLQPLDRVRVARVTINEENSFWKPLIGATGSIQDHKPDGLFDVMLDEDGIPPGAIDPQIVISGTKAERLEFVSRKPLPPPKSRGPIRRWLKKLADKYL